MSYHKSIAQFSLLKNFTITHTLVIYIYHLCKFNEIHILKSQIPIWEFLNSTQIPHENINN